MTAISVCAKCNSPETKLLAFCPNWDFFFFSFHRFSSHSRNKKKTMQFKRPELPACHLAVTLNCLCSAWAVFSHTHKHPPTHPHTQSCCSVLKFHHEWGRKTEEEERNIQNDSNKIFLLLWDAPLLVQHQEEWSGKGPLLVSIQRERRERDLFPLGKDRK